MTSRTRVSASWLLATVVLLAGCDQTFEPLQETDRVFSIYGYLEATADTQWIRVMPIRASIFSGPDPIDAVVTRENLANGRTLQLRDSLFSFRPFDPAGEDLHAFNFSTTERIEPGGSYRGVRDPTSAAPTPSSGSRRLPRRSASGAGSRTQAAAPP
jgi:hypothetical protein